MFTVCCLRTPKCLKNCCRFCDSTGKCVLLAALFLWKTAQTGTAYRLKSPTHLPGLARHMLSRGCRCPPNPHVSVGRAQTKPKLKLVWSGYLFILSSHTAVQPAWWSSDLEVFSLVKALMLRMLMVNQPSLLTSQVCSRLDIQTFAVLSGQNPGRFQ